MNVTYVEKIFVITYYNYLSYYINIIKYLHIISTNQIADLQV